MPFISVLSEEGPSRRTFIDIAHVSVASEVPEREGVLELRVAGADKSYFIQMTLEQLYVLNKTSSR